MVFAVSYAEGQSKLIKRLELLENRSPYLSVAFAVDKQLLLGGGHRYSVGGYRYLGRPLLLNNEYIYRTRTSATCRGHAK